ncbi:MAG: DUF2073 domain-containing protein [Candidatus Woesearchaeota archaeon]
MSLTLQFIPYAQIQSLSSTERIDLLLGLAKKNKIVLLEGRLEPSEEASLIEKTMASISKKFKGIELSVIYPGEEEQELFAKVKNRVVNLLLGNRGGFTIIGPASVIKEIKQDPDKIQLLTQ